MKRINFLSFLALSLLIAACGTAAPTPEATPIPTVIDDSAIITEGRLEPIRYVELSLNASGLVSEVLVTEGEQVAAGQVIAHLESAEAKTLETALADASAELTTAYQGVRDAQYDLDNFDIPSDFNDMTPAQAVEMTLENLNVARDNFEPYKYLSERSFELTKAERRAQREGGQDSQVYRDTAKLLKKRLDDAWADYRKAIQWMELESTLTSAQSRLNQAQKDYDNLQDPALSENTAGARAALANAEVRAPFAGIITNLDLKVGEFASAGTPIITIADTSKWVIKTTDLTEIDVVELADGQPVSIILDAIPDVTLQGNVFSIAQNYSENQGDIVYEVTVLLTDSDPAMRWGMTAEVRFE
jgi:multidrug resistance efflux pump